MMNALCTIAASAAGAGFAMLLVGNGAAAAGAMLFGVIVLIMALVVHFNPPTK